MKFDRFIELSRALMYKVEKTQKHFSFLVDGDKILAIGYNHLMYHPKAKHYGYQFGDLHSELGCLLKHAQRDCSGFEMVNVRLNRFGEVRQSKPCLTCQRVLRMFKVKKIHYSIDYLGNFDKMNV